MCTLKAVVLSTMALAAASAGVIGQWNGSEVDPNGSGVLTWNFTNPAPTYSTTKIHDMLTAAGNTIAADAAITTANLALYDSFVIRKPAAAPTGAELAILADWISNGGVLLMFADGSTNTTVFTSILVGVGSTLTAGGSMDQNMYLVGGFFMTDGLAGNFLSGTPGVRISGGTAATRGGAGWTASQQAAAAAYIHYEQIGLGYVVAFGDALDVNYFSFSEDAPRTKMFLNAASWVNPRGGAAADPPVDPVTSEAPEASSFELLAVGAAVAAAARLRAKYTR